MLFRLVFSSKERTGGTDLISPECSEPEVILMESIKLKYHQKNSRRHHLRQDRLESLHIVAVVSCLTSVRILGDGGNKMYNPPPLGVEISTLYISLSTCSLLGIYSQQFYNLISCWFCRDKVLQKLIRSSCNMPGYSGKLGGWPLKRFSVIVI